MFKILIPVNSSNKDDAKICKIDDKKTWVFLEIEEGKVINLEFIEDRTTIKDWIDCVIVENNNEYVWPFLEENITVLMAPSQKTIEEIVQAFLFKDLHDINI